MNLPDSVETAIREVAERHKLSPYALLQKTNAAPIVAARREVFRILRDQGKTLDWIGRWFGLDHSTVCYHLKAAGKTPPLPKLPRQVPFNRGKRFCARCGFQGASLIPEGYHFVCTDRTACNERYEAYMEFRHALAARLQHQVSAR